jgi:hypothetical protein
MSRAGRIGCATVSSSAERATSSGTKLTRTGRTGCANGRIRRVGRRQRNETFRKNGCVYVSTACVSTEL